MFDLASLAVVMTCHNRRDTTIRCLERLSDQKNIQNISVKVFLVDDGSTDGTSSAVKEKFPEVNIIRGDGSLYWTGGMNRAMNAAMKEDFDFFLWLNDDTMLYDYALEKMLSLHSKKSEDSDKEGIVVGSLCDPDTGQWTYGGSVKCSSWHPLKFEPVTPDSSTDEADNFWGNLVLIPHSIVRIVGNLDGKLVHGAGDHDYAIRAKKAGFDIWVEKEYLGECARNAKKNTWEDNSLTLVERFRHITSVKVMPPKNRFYYLKKHSGMLLPILFFSPYIRLLFNHLYHSLFGKEKHESTKN